VFTVPCEHVKPHQSQAGSQVIPVLVRIDFEKLVAR
jgi:hypothetical protein